MLMPKYFDEYDQGCFHYSVGGKLRGSLTLEGSSLTATYRFEDGASEPRKDTRKFKTEKALLRFGKQFAEEMRRHCYRHLVPSSADFLKFQP